MTAPDVAAVEDVPVEAPPVHQIRMLAGLSLLLTAHGWVVEEDPVARLDPDDELVCVNEGHVLNGSDRDQCELLKEQARGMPVPSAKDLADAFQRAVRHGWEPGRPRAN